MRRPSAILFSTIALIGLLLRCASSTSPLWLDEIVSLEHARDAGSLHDLIWAFPSDNNHLLNSAWLLLTAPSYDWAWLRLPALFGAGLMLISVAKLSILSHAERLFLLVIVSVSYVFALYQSEARGYGLMIGCAFAALTLEVDRSQSSIRLFTCWLVCCVGFLAQFTFINFYAALVVWSFLDAWRYRERRVRAFLSHLPVLAFISGAYFLYIQSLPPGTGALRSYGEVLLNLTSVAAGGPALSPSSPERSLIALVAACLFAGIVGGELLRLVRERSRMAPFYILALLVVPLLGLVVVAPRVLYERYLLGPVFVAYCVLAHYFARMWAGSSAQRGVAAALLAAFVSGNAAQLAPLLRYGRGQYPEAVTYMHARCAAPCAWSSDHEFRNETVLSFYADLLSLPDAFRYVTPRDAEIYIAHSQDAALSPLDEIEIEGTKFALAREFRSAELSGWRWFVYARTGGHII